MVSIDDTPIDDTDSDSEAEAEESKDDKGSESGEESPADSDYCIGIDLGTTFSCVAVWKDERAQVIPNQMGNRTTPSWVSFQDGRRLVGEAAKEGSERNPKNTIFDAKRIIGRSYSDPAIQADLKSWPFEVVSRVGDKPMIVVMDNDERMEKAPEEISSALLQKLKIDAEGFLGCKVGKAVITVPAHFNDRQRQATIDAGKIAGLEVLRVINEPTAAALAYGLDAKADVENFFTLVFDLGGGTFDVSLLKIEDSMFQVKATSGDTHLGGQDFDNKIVSHCMDMFIAKNKGELSKGQQTSMRKDPKVLAKLRSACETAKRALSAATSARVEVDSLYQGIELSITLTRAKFEELNGEVFRDCLKPVEDVLVSSKITKDDVGAVVLVGGSTRIPFIKKLLLEYFDDREDLFTTGINPDEAVACGAAIQGAILVDADEQEDSRLSSLVLLDVIPLTLGLETDGSVMTPIIKRNTSIPFRKSKRFTTAVDGQEKVSIRIFEGERALTRDNHELGSFMLTPITSDKRGKPVINVTYSVDVNGILTVSAVEKTKEGKVKCQRELTVAESRRNLSSEAIARMVKDSEEFNNDDKDAMARVNARLQVENQIYSVKEQVEEKSAELPAEAMQETMQLCQGALSWCNTNRDTATAEEILAKGEEFSTAVSQKLAAAQQGAASGGGGGMPGGGMPGGGMPGGGMPGGGMGGMGGMPGGMPGGMGGMGGMGMGGGAGGFGGMSGAGMGESDDDSEDDLDSDAESGPPQLEESDGVDMPKMKKKARDDDDSDEDSDGSAPPGLDDSDEEEGGDGPPALDEEDDDDDTPPGLDDEMENVD